MPGCDAAPGVARWALRTASLTVGPWSPGHTLPSAFPPPDGPPPGGCQAVLPAMPAEGAACREGRDFVSAHLLSWGVPERVVDVAVLITSELVANAVTHGPPPVGLRLRA